MITHAHPSAATAALTQCARCVTPLELGDLRCALCGLAAPVARHAVEQERARVLRCTECGAAVSFEVETQAPKCGFCSAVMRVEQPIDPVEQASWVARFAVSPADASQMLRRWLKTLGFFRPSDLSASASLESLLPLFWAGWVVNARALVSWTADSDAGSGRSSWAPHAGQTVLSFDNLLISASRGLRHDECARLVSRYDLRALGPATAHASAGPAGALLESFDAQRSAARRLVVEAIEATAAERLRHGHIPGSRFRKVHVATLLENLTTERVALPAYVLAYRYRGRPYRAIVHGQDARCVFGTAPISVGKILLVVFGVIAAIAAVIAIVVAIASTR